MCDISLPIAIVISSILLFAIMIIRIVYFHVVYKRMMGMFDDE